MSDSIELTMKDDKLNDLPGVREWLDEVARLIEKEMDI